ncbi:MAG: cupin domain-containing protein [Actinomycetota bacterium]|nr:cupin domain-containing protein [Actinomycetota bacterium]
MLHLSESERRGRPGAGPGYDEFLRVPSLSAGTYVVPTGGVDDQQPHREDEVYVVLAGAARFTGGDETVDVRTGSVLFVPAYENHRFHDVTADLEVLVVFGPAETQPAG